jgi:hypothetical protein
MRLKQSAISGSSIAGGLTALLGTLLFTTLLYLEKIGQVTYVSLLSFTAIVSLVLHGFSRVREIDLKNLKIVLDPMAEIKPGSYRDESTGNRIGISVSPYYSIVKVNDIEYYFKRETGGFDGYSMPTNDQE